MLMAIRGFSSSLSSKLPLQTLRSRFIRPLNSLSSSTSYATISPLNFAGKQDATVQKLPTADSILNFEDGKGLFSSVSTGKLIRSALTLEMAAVGPVVDLGTWVMNSRLMDMSLLRKLILGFTKRTFFEHFVAGANAEEAGETVKMIWDEGLRGMLDYGLEHADDNVSCDRNSEAFIRTVDSTKSLPASSVSFLLQINKSTSKISVFVDSIRICRM